MGSKGTEMKKNKDHRSAAEEQYKGDNSEAEKENLGLDADGSSRWSEGEKNWNSDNDRITGNPDGEDDDQDTSAAAGHSPLMDK